ncbi:hypothetical protein K1719_031309 [Acacia pycnantha]|nr:hypothetical protein K1719_031309 [Acacia pycnantha]
MQLPNYLALWRFICKQKQIIEEQTGWRVRNGLSVEFFNDIWLFQGKRIKDMCGHQLSVEENNSKVSDWCSGGVWNFSRLESLVPREVIQRLLAVLPPMPEAGNDVMLWNGATNGQFSVKSAYFNIFLSNEHAYHRGYSLIWKWKGLERIKVFTVPH